MEYKCSTIIKFWIFFPSYILFFHLYYYSYARNNPTYTIIPSNTFIEGVDLYIKKRVSSKLEVNVKQGNDYKLIVAL